MSTSVGLWRGNCASLELVTQFREGKDRQTLVLKQSSSSYLPGIDGSPLSNEEARALAAVLLEFARDK